MDNIAVRIKNQRLKAGLSQNEVASRLGITKASYAQYEQGRRTPKYETMEKIADAIGCDLFDLILMPDLPDNIDGVLQDNEGAEINELIKDLKEEEKKIKEDSSLKRTLKWSIEFLEREIEISSRHYPLPSSMRDKQKELLDLTYSNLNQTGKNKLIKYAEDLSLIVKYRNR